MATPEENPKSEEGGSSPMRKKRKRETSEVEDDIDDDDEDFVPDGDSEDSKSLKSEQQRPPDPGAPRVVHGIVDFKLSPVVAHFTCPLCHGLFKDPVTITECLHSFCKSCLFGFYSSGNKNCPSCDTYLGPDPFKSALNDRTLESLGDKVLFTDVKRNDEREERAFYASRGILPKPEAKGQPSSIKAANPLPVAEAADELDLLLVQDQQADDQHELPKLQRSCIRTSGRLKIGQLKKYLLRTLEMPPSLLSYVEISCNGNPVGNELSLLFIERTVWPSTTEQLRLLYRLSDDLLLV